MPPTRVFIVARSPEAGEQVRAQLEAGGLSVVGQAPDMFHLQDVAADVVVLTDEELPTTWGGQPDAWRDLSMVVITRDKGAANVMRRLGAASWGVVSDGASSDALCAVVAAVANGFVTLPINLADQILGRVHGPDLAGIETIQEPLTAREREVLDLLSQGLANRAIARYLGISENTVKFHVSSIYGKLGATSRTEAVTRGVRRGLIEL